jgi:ubiquinone/menaquinone biosynthesis C-methylase UbiE
VKTYYARRAQEYDATSYETLGSAGRHDLRRMEAAIAALEPARVLDVACGTGYLTARLRGEVVGLDQSEEMLDIARERLPAATFVCAEAPPLPFADGAFDRVFASHFYSHLDGARPRRALVAEALRVAGELVVAEEAWRPGLPRQAWEQRALVDGTEWPVFKRYYTAERLRAELDGEVLLATPTFILVRTRRPPGARRFSSPARAAPPSGRPG